MAWRASRPGSSQEFAPAFLLLALEAGKDLLFVLVLARPTKLTAVSHWQSPVSLISKSK